MLLSLKIENFALIDQLELSFSKGLNVLTGETGAGKSIILDALDIVLGGKVSPAVVRTGCDRSSIEALFHVTPAIAAWLVTHEIDPLDEDSLVCSRDLTLTQGTLRSRSRVNGILVNRQQLDTLRDRLVELTAQGQTVQLGDPIQQRAWLDQWGGGELIECRHHVSDLFTVFQQAQQALDRRKNSEHQRLQRLDFLTFQVNELQALSLDDPEELDQLTQDYQRLSHSQELQQQSYQVYQHLYANDQGRMAASDLLGKSASLLTAMLPYDPELQPVAELVNDALAQVEEAGRQMRNYGDRIETDPQRLQDLEERIAELKQVCRKYGPTLADAIAYRHQIEAEFQDLKQAEESLDNLEQNYRNHQAALEKACVQLTAYRRQAAMTLEAKLLQELKPLAMEKVRFQVELSILSPTAMGADRVTFQFSPNPGEPLQPLSAVASGGEMSRFLLALKTCFSHVEGVQTLVFDEIDVGVSGRVTQAIAQKLYGLSQYQQVLCVTHQPIVAAMADAHFHVSKRVIQGTDNPDPTVESNRDDLDPRSNGLRTIVQVIRLDPEQRRTELAQLAGGQSAQEMIAFADALLNQAADLKQHPNDFMNSLQEPISAETKNSKRSSIAKKPLTASRKSRRQS